MEELTLTYSDEPAGIKEGTTPAIDDVQDFCKITDVLQTGNTTPQHATFEDGYWVLGKDFRLFPDQPSGLTWGVFSKQISDADGVFAVPITLVLALDALHSSVGMTLTFDPYGPTWCKNLHIDWWRYGEIISSKDFYPDTWQYVCYNEVHSFDMVSITFLQMSQGYRFLKLQSLTYGITRVFDSDEIFNLDLFQDTDLISDQVAVNVLDFTLRNKTAIDFLFQRKQTMRLWQGNELVGVYYISTSERMGTNRYELHTVDLVGLAEMAGNHLGGIYEGVRAADLVAEILGDIPWKMDADLKDVALYGWLPIAGKRDNLQQVAFALCAMVRTARRDVIEITRQSTAELKGEFGEFSSYEKGSVAASTMVTTVKVTAHRFTPKEEVESLYEETLNGVEELEFSDPVWGLQIEGGTILSSGANYVKFSGTGGVVRLTGKKYDHSKRIFTKSNPLVTASDAANPVAYEDMTLVSPRNVDAVLASCYAHNLRVETIKGKVLTGTEAPGDYVSILTDTDGVRTGHLISLDYMASGKIAADAIVLAKYEGEDRG